MTLSFTAHKYKQNSSSSSKRNARENAHFERPALSLSLSFSLAAGRFVNSRATKRKSGKNDDDDDEKKRSLRPRRVRGGSKRRFFRAFRFFFFFFSVVVVVVAFLPFSFPLSSSSSDFENDARVFSEEILLVPSVRGRTLSRVAHSAELHLVPGA